MLKSYPAITIVFAAVLLAACADPPKAIKTVAVAQKQERNEGAQEPVINEAVHEEKKKEPEFKQVITVLKPIGKVPVSVSYQGGVFYHVVVNNNLPTLIKLVWDESTYLNTKGEPVRILHIPKKSDLPHDLPVQQASSPISPNAQFQADFIGESWLDAARRGATPQPKDSLRKARIYLSFKIKGKRVKWQGEIAFIPMKQP